MPPYVITPGRDRRAGRDGARRHRGGHMRLTRVYVAAPLAPDADVCCPRRRRPRRRACCACARARPIVAFDGSGSEYRCEIARGEGRRVRGARRRAPAGLPRVAAAHHAGAGGLARRAHGLDAAEGHRTRRRARSCRCCPRAASCASTTSRPQKKLRHWQAIVAGACEQCGRSVRARGARAAGAVALPRHRAARGQRFVLSPTGPASLAGLDQRRRPASNC